jgi:UDP-N-acetylmuramoyl-tripeptide--D-alanyl-D-alanine ligase
LIDDSYNSSPAALESALKSLSMQNKARKVAILGEMLELGPDEKDFHFAAGTQVQETGWDVLVTVGPLGQHIKDGAIKSGMGEKRIFSFKTSDEAGAHIRNILRKGDLVLVKGSRGIRTEKIVKSIKKDGL